MKRLRAFKRGDSGGSMPRSNSPASDGEIAQAFSDVGRARGSQGRGDRARRRPGRKEWTARAAHERPRRHRRLGGRDRGDEPLIPGSILPDGGKWRAGVLIGSVAKGDRRHTMVLEVDGRPPARRVGEHRHDGGTRWSGS